MQYAEHEKLIKALELKVKEGLPATGFTDAYFKAAWVLIKKIGPSFKETNYPKRPLRDAAWKSFQAAVDILKAQQSDWELATDKLQAELLEQIEKARPNDLTMAELMGLKAPPIASLTEEELKVPPAQRRKNHLDACTVACDAALKAFMDVKTQLSHAQYRVISAKLAEVRQQIQKGWNDFRREGKASAEERKAEREDPHSDYNKKLRRHLRTLTDALANDEACLDSKKGAITSFEKLLKTVKDPAELTRLQSLITEAQTACAELETNIAGLKARCARGREVRT